MGALDVEVSEYKAFTARLKAAEKTVRASLRKRIRDVGKPLGQAVAQDGPEGLPSSGGLADWLRAARPTLSMTATRLTLKVSRGRHDINAINAGRLRHPVYGNRRLWVQQAVTAGTYDKAFEKHAEAALPEIARVVDDIMKEI